MFFCVEGRSRPFSKKRLEPNGFACISRMTITLQSMLKHSTSRTPVKRASNQHMKTICSMIPAELGVNAGPNTASRTRAVNGPQIRNLFSTISLKTCFPEYWQRLGKKKEAQPNAVWIRPEIRLGLYLRAVCPPNKAFSLEGEMKLRITLPVYITYPFCLSSIFPQVTPYSLAPRPQASPAIAAVTLLDAWT